MTERSVAIYALLDPASGSVGYVGKTVLRLSTRLSNHLSDARRQGDANKRTRWINSLPEPPKIVLVEEVTEDRWDEAEREWIAHYRSLGQAQANTHSGGQRGPRGSGHKQSEETRKKIASALKGRKPSQAQVVALRHHRESPRSDQHRESSRASMKSYWRNLSESERAEVVSKMQAGRKHHKENSK